MDTNVELLEYIYETAKMGSSSMDRLCELLESKENLIRKDIDNTQKGYQKFKERSDKLLKKRKAEAKPNAMFAEMMSKMGIKKEVDEDNSDSAIAKMIIEGLNMGIIDMESKIKQFKDDVDKDVLKFAKEFLRFQKDEVELYKEYL